MAITSTTSNLLKELQQDHSTCTNPVQLAPITVKQGFRESAYNKFTQFSKMPCTWLRVYPLPQSPGETVGSVILRCALCQFGLATFLVMWTAIWMFIIHYFEGTLFNLMDLTTANFSFLQVSKPKLNKHCNKFVYYQTISFYHQFIFMKLC